MSKTSIDQRPPVTSMARRFALPTQKAFLSQAVLLEEAGPPRAPALVCLLGFAFVAIAILASMLIEIDVVTNSTGRIEAADGNHVLQSFDGGIVDRIDVEEGQIVEVDDILMTLDDPTGRSQINSLILREAALLAQVRRLQTLIGLPSTAAISHLNDAQAVSDEQMLILRLEEEAVSTERSLIRAEIERSRKTLQNARNLKKDAKTRLSLITDNLGTDRHLYSKGLLPKDQLLETERQSLDATVELKQIEGQIREAEAGLIESKRRLDSAVASRKQRQGDQLSSILIDLHETRQQIEALRQRLARAEIRSPAKAIVMELKVRHPGQTVAPGDPMVEIIPIDGGLAAETRLLPSEISHVHKGQSVRLAIDGMEPHRHGYLEGNVEAISPSTFIDDNAQPYYRTTIRLASDRLNTIPLTPGMTVQAQIKTGQRTILEYLLKPVYRAWNTAFRER